MAVERRGDKGRVTVTQQGRVIRLTSWIDYDEAVQFNRDYQANKKAQAESDAPADLNTTHKTATVEGVIPDKDFDASKLWDFAIEGSQHVFEKQRRKQRQLIELPNEPVAVAILSDLHIGGAGADYANMKRDADLIADTPGMYAGFHGDATDNWIVGKLTALQRGQAVGFDVERMLFEDWVNIVGHKLLWWVQGNHDLWSEKLCGTSPNRDHLKDIRALYDGNQCIFRLVHADTCRLVVVRHKWRFNSVFNPTHGLEVGWDRGDIDYDWAVGGHTHIGTYCRPFHRHGRMRYAILTGTYKLVDGFGEEVGFPEPKGSGCGAMVMHPDGRQWFFDSLPIAADFLGYLRHRFTTTE